MAESHSKRPRDESHPLDVIEEAKRHKPYNHILSLLEEEEEEPNQDLSSLMTTLQQEITAVTDQENEKTATVATSSSVEDCDQSLSSSSSSSSLLKEDDEEDKERVIRHLLEASDDELGIPNREEEIIGGRGEEDLYGGVDGFAVCDYGLWEIEDANANYYTLLQSELFM